MSKFILKVTKNDGKIERSDFETNAEAVAHFEKYKAISYWGTNEYTINYPEVTINHPEILEVLPVAAAPEIPAILDGDGNVITPAIPAIEEVIGVVGAPAWVEVIPAYSVNFPADYSWEILDKSAEVNAKELKENTKKADRVTRIDQFKLIDWATIDNIAKLRTIVRALVKEAIKDEE